MSTEMEQSPFSILHLSTQPAFRGGERQIAYLHDGLRKTGIDSRLIFDKRCREFLAYDETIGCAAGLQHAALSFVNARSLENGLIHAHDSRAFTLAMGIHALSGVPVVFTRKVVAPVRRSAFNAWKYTRAAGIVAISQAVANEVRRGIPAVHPVIIPDGVVAGTGLSREAAREKLGLSSIDVVAGTVGYFTREKNLPLLFQVARDLSHLSNFKIACVGAVSERDRAGAPPNIVFCGVVPCAETVYAAFDCYLSVSLREGLGSALLDAVVRGIPTVALDAGGTRDIYPAADVSLIARGDESCISERIRDIILEPSKARYHASKLQTGARTRFSIDRFVASHVALYHTILNPDDTE